MLLPFDAKIADFQTVMFGVAERRLHIIGMTKSLKGCAICHGLRCIRHEREQNDTGWRGNRMEGPRMDFCERNGTIRMGFEVICHFGRGVPIDDGMIAETQARILYFLIVA